ncbi:hypothetical protein HMPREF0793_1701 [Staphylococcus caprae M23864:W1]|nr:hypothetical protein HMPREF0793_1701 [Staphylococcus caprae M23864:W1]
MIFKFATEPSKNYNLSSESMVHRWVVNVMKKWRPLYMAAIIKAFIRLL